MGNARGAMRIAGYATPSLRLRNASWRLARQMKNGDASLDRSTTRSLTATVLYALQTDLSTEARVKLLQSKSLLFRPRLAQAVVDADGLVEPICLCLVGLVVGIAVVGLFLPLISLINGLA